MNYDEFGNEIYVNDKELTYEKLERIAASKVRGSILWMVLGLFITGITGYYFINSIINGTMPEAVISKFNYIIGGVIILELIVVYAFTALTYKASATTLKLMFIFYSFLNGITMSVLILAYSQSSIIYAFSGTVVLFTILAIYGYVTREDLTKYSSILKAGVISLIAMGIINIFLKSDTLMWVSSMLGIIVFIIFIAVDVNRIKNNVLNYAINEDMSIINKIEIHGALSLYLDFINLFIFILRIVGRRK